MSELKVESKICVVCGDTILRSDKHYFKRNYEWKKVKTCGPRCGRKLVVSSDPANQPFVITINNPVGFPGHHQFLQIK